MQSEKQPLPHQYDMLEAIYDTFYGDDTRGYIDSATGTGKDFVIAQAVGDFLDSEPDLRMLYLCHNKFILGQAMTEMAGVVDPCNYGRMFDGIQEGDKQHIFGTFRTMNNNLRGNEPLYKTYDPEEFDIVIVNESHHGPAPTYRPVIEWYRPRMLLGATATAERRDEQDIAEIFGDPIYNLSLEDAIVRGILARPEYHVLTDHIRQLDNFTGQMTKADRKLLEEINGFVFVPKRDEEIVNTITSHLEEIDDPRTLIFCASIEHAEHFNELLPGLSTTLHSDMPLKEQDRRLEAFRKGEIPTLLVVDMLNEGVDVPEINVVVFLRSTESKTVFFQQVGRGLRNIEGKDKVVFLDFVANWGRLSTLRSLQAGIKRARNTNKQNTPRQPRRLWEIDGDIKFNFSAESMEAVKVVEEARERERRRKPASKRQPRVDKWLSEEDAIKSMLGIEELRDQRISGQEWSRYEQRLMAGDPAAREEVVMRCLRRAYGTARQFAEKLESNELTMEDHFHHAVEGIYEGIYRFLSGKGSSVSLGQQVSLGIFNRVHRAAHDRGLVRFPLHINDKLAPINKAQQKLERTSEGAAMTETELTKAIAKAVKMDPEDVGELRALQDTLGYEGLLPVDDSLDKIAAPDESPDPQHWLEDLQTRQQLKEALEGLSYRERRLLELRYGLGGETPLSLDETGRHFNVTRERIRQIENQSLKKLQVYGPAQPLREPEPVERPQTDQQRRDWQAAQLKKEDARTLARIAENALKADIPYRAALQAIADETGGKDMHLVGIADAVMGQLHFLARYRHGRNSTFDKHWLRDRLQHESGVAADISHTDYIRALNALERHAAIRCERNERGTIIERVALADKKAENTHDNAL